MHAIMQSKGAAIETVNFTLKRECHYKTNIIQRNGTLRMLYKAHVWLGPEATRTEMP